MPEVTLVTGPSTGGLGRHVRSLAGGLTRRGWRVQVAAPAATLTAFGFAAVGAGTVALPDVTVARPLDLLAGVRRLRSASAGSDVVHAHGVRAGLLAAAAHAPAPLVVSWHNAALGDPARRAVHGLAERAVARRSACLLAASADLAATARRGGAGDVRVLEVAAPAPAPSRSRAEVRAELGAADRPLVVAVARLDRQKRLDLLVRAAATLAGRRPPPLVVVAGEGPQRAALARLAEATGAPVSLLGARGDAVDLLAAADVAVLSSAWEARALAAQEALGLGVPLVATAVGGLPQLCGDAALLVPADDAAALAAALARVLDEPVLAARLHAAGPLRAAGWPDEQQTVDAVVAVYRDVCAAGNGAPW